MLITTPQASMRFAFSLLFFFSVRFLLADTTQANALLQQGRVDEATTSLRELLAAHPGDGPAHQLLCRIYYAQDMADHAIHQCLIAAPSDPATRDHQLRRGRAL